MSIVVMGGTWIIASFVAAAVYVVWREWRG